MTAKIKSFIFSFIAVTISSISYASPEVGSVSELFIMNPNSSKYLDVSLKLKEESFFDVVGSGNGDIDCFILDSDKNMVAKDFSANDSCHMVVMPRDNKDYTFFIKNYGKEETLVRFSIK